jgi:tetratricopeptide (TPR) repeat protein
MASLLFFSTAWGFFLDPAPQAERQTEQLEQLAKEKPAEAIPRLEALVRDSPSPRLYFLLARAWSQVDAEQSIPWLERLFELSPEYEPAWQLWADIMSQGKQYGYAVSRLERQLNKNPGLVHLHLLLGQFYVNKGDLSGAQKEFREVIHRAAEGSGERTRGLYSLGYLLVSSERFEEGEPLLAQALDRDASYVPEIASLAELLAAHEQWNDAGRLLEHALRVRPGEPRMLFLRGRCHFEQGEWSQAVASLTEVLKRQPDRLEAHYYAGRAHHAAGHEEQAARHSRGFRDLYAKSHLERFASTFRIDSSNAKVTEILKNIAAYADPQLNIFLNEQRVEMYTSRIEREKDPGERLALRLRRAWEMLQAGASESAVEEALDIRRAIGSGRKPDDPALEPATELVALSYLRLGEQQNCFTRHNAASCLVPLAGAGIHKLQRPSRLAIEELGSLLEAHPDNLGFRWLLNLAYMAVGEYPDKIPNRRLIPPKVFESEYEIGRFRDVAAERGLTVDGLAGGSIMEDFDVDGHLDIVTSSWGLRDPLRYFRNDGNGSFSEWTRKAGLDGQWGGLNLVQGDYNNDGYPDILVLRGAWLGFFGPHQGDLPNSLLRNNGDGTFTDVTRESGLLSFHASSSAAWADYDLDGWLDLFIANESTRHEIHPCELFHNNRDGTFTEVASSVGLNAIGVVKGAVWGDYNNDRYPDLYLSRFAESNLLYRNDGARGSGWRFTEVSRQARVTEPKLSFPVWFWDYDNDGWEDILVASFASYFEDALGAVAADYLKLSKAEHSRLYRNNHDGTFADVTREAKMDAVLLTMGANFGDLDNDGFLDCYFGTGQPNLSSLVPNRMFRNDRGRYFQDVTTSGGFGHLQKGHGISFGDIDNDGDQDIYAVFGGAYSGDTFPDALFENPGNSNHWVTLRLQGVTCNRSAVGARVKITVLTDEGSRSIYSTVGAGGSFGASSLQQEIGLGKAKAIRSIEIRWPVKKGSAQVFADVPMDRIVRIRQGDPHPVVVNRVKARR